MPNGKIIPCPDCKRLFISVYAMKQHAAATHENPDWLPGDSSTQKKCPVCPKCGSLATITNTKYRPRAEHCGLHSWNLKPLVDDATHKARNAAHAAFDPLWKRRQLSREEAYSRLAKAMGMTSDACHIARMNAKQARRVVEIVESGALTKEIANA